MEDDIWQNAGRSIGSAIGGRALLPAVVEQYLRSQDQLTRRALSRSGRRETSANNASTERSRPSGPLFLRTERTDRSRRDGYRVMRSLPAGVELPTIPLQRAARHIGELSEQMEIGHSNPGAIGDTEGDAGGRSYGLAQLATQSRQPQAFLRREGQRWSPEFGGAAPATPQFDRTWQAIAAREPQAFGEAQRAFIARTHYRPAIEAALATTGMNLDTRSDAVRAAAWSTAVQHAAGPELLTNAIFAADRAAPSRSGRAYDAALLRAIYDERSNYARSLEAEETNPNRRQLHRNMQHNRFVEEPRLANEWLDREGR